MRIIKAVMITIVKGCGRLKIEAQVVILRKLTQAVIVARARGQIARVAMDEIKGTRIQIGPKQVEAMAQFILSQAERTGIGISNQLAKVRIEGQRRQRCRRPAV